MDVHTHTHNLATHIDRFAITFWKGKTPQKEKSEEKPQMVLIVASFQGDDEKAQYASFKRFMAAFA